MIHANEALLVDGAGFRYEVRRSPRRRTVAIEVHPDLRVIVRAPAKTDAQVIAAQVAERSRWIARAMQRFRHAGVQPPPSVRYHDGEPHLFMGEPYRLQLSTAQRAGVTIQDGRIRIALPGEPTPQRVRRALEAWYRDRLLEMAAGIVAEWMGHFSACGHAAPTVRVRRMTTRWGSLADRRRMTLNLALVHVPRECLEYVVVHELCHLEHRGHGPAFYRLMDRLLPDWRERRKRLMALRAAA
jgi:hypothetical protein